MRTGAHLLGTAANLSRQTSRADGERDDVRVSVASDVTYT